MQNEQTPAKQQNISNAQLQQAYADTIQVLFNGLVYANASDITNEVMFQVDTMMIEMAKCSQHMTQLSFELIFNAAWGLGKAKLLEKVDDYLSPDNSMIMRMLVEFIENDPTGKLPNPVNHLKKHLLNWVQSLQGNHWHMFCLAVARSRYRSPIQIALLGL